MVELSWSQMRLKLLHHVALLGPAAAKQAQYTRERLHEQELLLASGVEPTFEPANDSADAREFTEEMLMQMDDPAFEDGVPEYLR